MEHPASAASGRDRDAGRSRPGSGRRPGRRTIMGLVLLVSVALVAAACGGDDSGNDAAATTTTAAGGGASTTAAAGGAATSTTGESQPITLDAWEALWKKQRDAVVKRITDNKWGKSADGKTVTGP